MATASMPSSSRSSSVKASCRQDALPAFSDSAPLGFVAGDPNLYRYVGNAPTNHTDPAGLAKLLCVGRDPFKPNTPGTTEHSAVVVTIRVQAAAVANGRQAAAPSRPMTFQYVLSWEGDGASSTSNSSGGGSSTSRPSSSGKNGWRVVPYDEYLKANKHRDMWIIDVPGTSDQKIWAYVQEEMKKRGDYDMLKKNCAEQSCTVLTYGGATQTAITSGRNDPNPRSLRRNATFQLGVEKFIPGKPGDPATR